METNKKPYKAVYTVVERPRDGRKFWLRVGAAFTNQDGSLNVQLDAMPTNGQLHIREVRVVNGVDHRPEPNVAPEKEAA